MALGSFIETTVGPASKRIIDLAAVKTELGITDSASDAKLTRLIDAATAAFAGAYGLQREFWRRTVEESVVGRGGELLFVENWPVESVTSITEAGTTVTASEYSIEGWRRDRIYRDNGWARDSQGGFAYFTSTGNEEFDTVATYVGGWVMPEKLSDWTASTAYAVGDFVRSSSTSDLFLFECTAAGTSDSSEPTWPTTEDGTVVDNGATWTARYATEFPQDLREAAYITVTDWFAGGLEIPSGIVSERFESMGVTYGSPGGQAGGIPYHAQMMIRGYQ